MAAADEDLTRMSESDGVTRLIVREEIESLKAGQVLRDRFVIEGLLGEGGMGQVFLARDRQAEKTHPFVALKVLGATFKDHPQAFAALRREATQSRTLSHPNIVAVYDFDRADNYVYMVMEYLKGQALDVLINNRPQGSQLREVWPYIEGIGLGLEYVHRRNIVHADVKPRNVLVTENGDVKVLDLGIARTLDENQLAAGTTTRFDPAILGALTPQYASPEMFAGLAPRPQDDLFALGCITFELLTGQHPYGRRPSVEARAMAMEVVRPPGLKNRQWKALRAALSFNRSERQSSVDEFLKGMTPERSASSPWPWIAVATVLVVAMVTQFWMQYGVSDAELINDLLEQNPLDVTNVASPDEVSNWELFAKEMHDIGNVELGKGEFEYALSLFTDRSSGAWRNYFQILTRAADDVVRHRAAENSLRLARDLKAAAAALQPEPSNLPMRLRLICSALEIVQEPDLLETFLGAVDEDIAAVKNNPTCVKLLERSRQE